MPDGSTPRSQAETLSILTDLVQRHDDNFAKHNQQMESMQQSIKDLQISMAKIEKIPALLWINGEGVDQWRPAEISYFSGEGVDQWLHQIECFFIRYQTAPEQKFVVVVPYLSGEAMEWYRQMWLARRLSTWDNFAADLRCRFWRIEAANKAASMDEKLDRMIALLERTMPTPNSESEPESCVPVETDMVDKSIDVPIKSDSAVATGVVDEYPKEDHDSLEAHTIVDQSVVVDSVQTQVTFNHLSSEVSVDFVLNKFEVDDWKETQGFAKPVYAPSCYISKCSPTVCENASVYLPSFSLAHETFNGNWCSIQLFYMAAVCPNPPWKPPDDRTCLELKWMSLPMSENGEIENINEEELRIAWNEAETKKGVAITLESMLTIDTLGEYVAELEKGGYGLFESFARLYLLNSSVGQTAGEVGDHLLSTDAEWDLADHSNALRHCNDGLILLVWVEKPPPLPPELESAIGHHMIRCRGDLCLPIRLPSMEFKVLPMARVKFKRVYGTFGIWNEVLLFCYSRMGRTDVPLDYLKVKRLFKWLVLVKVFKIIFPITFTLLMKEMPRGALTCFAKYVLLHNKRLTLSCKAFIVAGVGITKMKRSNKLLRDELGNEVKSTGFGESTELSDAIEDSKELKCSFVSHENHLLLDSRVDYSALSCVSFVAARLSLSGPIYMAIESEELISPEDTCIQIHSVDIRGPVLGLRLVSDTLIPDNLSLKIRFAKATDTAEIDDQLAQLGPELTSTLVIFILKSGGTCETMNCLLEVNTTFWEAGLNVASHYVVMAQENASMDRSSYFVANGICIKGWCSPQPHKHTPVDFKSVLVPKIDDKRLKSEESESGTIMSRSLNFCTELVRRNVCEILSYFLPPAKPPDDVVMCAAKEEDEVWQTKYNEEDSSLYVILHPVDYQAVWVFHMDKSDDLHEEQWFKSPSCAMSRKLNFCISDACDSVYQASFSFSDMLWYLVDHPSTLRHCTDGLILLGWVGLKVVLIFDPGGMTFDVHILMIKWSIFEVTTAAELEIYLGDVLTNEWKSTSFAKWRLVMILVMRLVMIFGEEQVNQVQFDGASSVRCPGVAITEFGADCYIDRLHIGAFLVEVLKPELKTTYGEGAKQFLLDTHVYCWLHISDDDDLYLINFEVGTIQYESHMIPWQQSIKYHRGIQALLMMRLFETILLNSYLNLDDHVSLVRNISKFNMFSLPRPPEFANLEDKVNFKGRGMLRTQVMAYYEVGGLKCIFLKCETSLYKAGK